MKNQGLGQWQDQVFKRISQHIKTYTLITQGEISKIFLPEQLHAAALYWNLFSPNLSSEQSPKIRFNHKEVIDLLAIIEISIKACLYHKGVVDESEALPGAGKAGTIAKNTRKILLGDMLIATLINAVNNLKDKSLKTHYYNLSKKIFSDNIGKSLSHSIPPSAPALSWTTLLPELCQKTLIQDWRAGHRKVIKLLMNSLGDPNPGKIRKKIMSLAKGFVSKKMINEATRKRLIEWLEIELISPLQNEIPGKEITSAKRVQRIENNSLYQLIE